MKFAALTGLAAGCLLGGLPAGSGVAAAQDRPVPLGESGLSIVLPKGWRTADKKPDFKETVGAFQSDDATASVFVSMTGAPREASMRQVMDGIITDFEEAFIVQKIGDTKTGELARAPSAFVMLDAEMRAAKGPQTMAFRFYLAVIDTGRGLYFFQGSIQRPVNPDRERELMAILRSLDRWAGG